jgi:hypothetical protein
METNMTDKHTPGPWYVAKPVYGDRQICDQGLREIADVGYEVGDKAMDANARLIASAPELLEACKLAQEAITRLHYTPEIAYLSERIDAAITKAEGK